MIVEEYSAWVVLKDKWPLALVVLAVILTIFIVRIVAPRAQKKKRTKDSEKAQQLTGQ